jgi:hypothetical protein
MSMSENEGGESRFMTGFLLGFLAGVLICLGVGGSIAFVWGRQQAMTMRAAEERARMAEMEARMEADMARRNLHRAQRAVEAAARAKEQQKK